MMTSFPFLFKLTYSGMFCQCTPVFNYSLGCLTTQLHHRNSAKPFNTTPSGIIQSSCTSNTTKWFNITPGLCLKHFSFKDLSSLSRYMKDFVMTVWDQIETRSCLNQERNMHRSSTVYKQNPSKTVLNIYVGGFWCERTTSNELEEVKLWIMDLYLTRSDSLKLKRWNCFL